MKQLLKYCLIAQLILALYFQLIFWVPLGNLNAQTNFTPVYRLLIEKKLSIEDLAFLMLFLIPVPVFYAGYTKNKYWLMVLSMIFYFVWLILQLTTWWIPYIFGASDKWYEVYNRTFLHTHKILPSWGRHLAPDTMHLIIQVLLLIIMYLFVKASIKRGSNSVNPTTIHR